MSSMRKCVLLAGPVPPAVGGVAAINELICKSIDGRRFQIITLNSWKYKEKFQISSFKHVLNFIIQLLEFLQFIYLLIKMKCQLVHVSLSSYSSFWKGSSYILIASLLKRKTILHLHGGAFHTFYNKSHSTVQRLIRFSFQKSDIIITISQYWKDFVGRIHKIPSKKVCILQNCYGFEFNQLDESIEQLEFLRYNSKELKILYVGTLNEQKGVLDLVEIFKQLDQYDHDIVLHIAGSTKDSRFLEKLKNKVNSNGFMNRVRLVGNIAGKKKLDLYKQCDIFILPSYIENFPLTVLEAMRAGLPVITTPVGALPEIIRDYENGFLVSPGDIGNYVEKLLLLIHDIDLRHSIAKLNIQSALKEYNPENYSSKLMKIYDKF